jgi:hypothetical protein
LGFEIDLDHIARGDDFHCGARLDGSASRQRDLPIVGVGTLPWLIGFALLQGMAAAAYFTWRPVV